MHYCHSYAGRFPNSVGTLPNPARQVDPIARPVATAESNELTTTPYTADEALEALSPDLQTRLGALADAPAEAAELAISLFPYGHRALLSSYGLIAVATPDGGSDSTADRDNPRRRIRLLDLGQRIIDACADPPEPIGPIEGLDDRTAAPRQRCEQELPFETKEAKS